MSTSKLQCHTSELLSVFLGQCTIRENYRPDWLVTDNGGYLELDFYIEELDAAIEVQGKQHAVFVPMFHKDYSDFVDAQRRDAFKRERCQGRGVKLFEVWHERDAFRVVDMLHLVAFQKGILEPQSTLPPEDLWVNYPSTIRKHLCWLDKNVRKANRTNQRSARIVMKISNSLRAIKCYQASKGVIEFDHNATALLRTAEAILSL